VTQKNHPPPWIFAILCLPMGTFWGFITTAMPFLLRKQGIAVEQIASISALTGIAQIVYVVWSPIADMIFTRRMWVLLLSLVSAAMLFVAVMLPVPQYLTLYAALLIVGNAVNTSTSIASGGLMAVLTHETLQGKAGGWYQAGNLGGGALAGGICIWLSTRVPDWQLATAAAAMVFVPSLAVLLVEEAPRDLSPNLALFTTMFHNLRDLMKQHATWLGFLFFLSPLGAAALGTLFSGVGVDYHASAKVVVLVTGVGGAICTAIGSVLGGHLCDHMDRRHAYILSGGLSAVVSGAMLFARTSPMVFAVGASAYLVIAGFSYAAYNALSLELTARDACTGGTRFSLFGAAANAPVAYMTWLDGQGHKLWGVRGLLGVDTVGSVVGVAGMLVIMYWMLRRSPAAVTHPASSFISS
jgi:MFS family permease